MAQLSDYRYERKFTSHLLDMQEVKARIHLHPALFTMAYPPRQVNNIYFDTLNYDCYQLNLMGATDRVKARIRWYGPLFGLMEQPALEFKIKKGLAGTKKSWPLGSLPFEPGIDLGCLPQWLSESNLPEFVQEIMCSLTPALVNCYHRHYFVSADDQFRLTVDQNLSYYPVQPRINHFLHSSKDDRQLVLELKYAIENEPRAESIVRALPLRVCRHSKYVNGLQAVYS